MRKYSRFVFIIALVMSLNLGMIPVFATDYTGPDEPVSAAESYEGEPPLMEEGEGVSEPEEGEEAQYSASAEAVQGNAVSAAADGAARSGRDSVSKMTMDEVRALYDAIPWYESMYQKAPVVSGAGYSPAVLSDEALDSALGWINYYRTAAGLTTVTFTEEANLYTSYGALCLAMNNEGLSHTPPKPADMSDRDYDIAYAATSSSNLSMRGGYSENVILGDSVSGQMCDSSISNMFTLGHRRWLIDPRMLTTGIGAAHNGSRYYAAVKVFNEGVSRNNSVNDYDFIAWPASGKNLTETFPANTPWSVTLNPNRYAYPELSEVQVTLKRVNDGKTWVFNDSIESGPNPEQCHFFVDNNGYGIDNCIVFRPSYDDIGDQVGNYEVMISGITDRSGNAKTLYYTVEFAPYESDISSYSVTLDQDVWNYTGQSIRPAVSVVVSSTRLIEGTDYTVSYSNNTQPGTATATVTGTGNYSGTATVSFTITKDEFVTFDANGGSNAPGYILIQDGKAVLPLQVPTYDRKNFAGWSEDPNAAAARYQPGDTVRSQNGIVLYAVWDDPYEITDGVEETANIAAGSGVWYHFVPEYSCNYRLYLNGSGKLQLIFGNRKITWTVGASGMSTTESFDKDADIYVYLSFADSAQTGNRTLSFTVEHTAETVIAAKDPTCTEDGCTAEKACTVCGTVFQHSEVIPATGHSWGTPTYVWNNDNSIVTASRKCKNDASHTETEQVNTSSQITKNPNCTEKGVRTYTAVFSNAAFAKQTKNVDIAAAGHKEETIPAVAATCTESGLTEGSKCSVCGEILKAQEVIPALGHSWDDGKIIKEATFDEEGEMLYTCTRCGETKTEKIPKVVIHVTSLSLNHSKEEMKTRDTLQLEAIIEPSDATNRNVTWTSSDAGVASVDGNGLITAHTYGKAVITATTEDGKKKASCEIQTRFYDVAGSPVKGEENYQYFFTPVYWAADHNPVITNGYGKIYFGTGMNCKREDMITFLWRAAGKPGYKKASSFTDVDKGIYYYDAVMWAAEKGITKGYSTGPDAGKFGVGKEITREDTVTFIYRAAGSPGYSKAKSFSDVESNKYYYKAIMWAAEKGITNGYSSGPNAGMFGVGFNVLREDIVTFLYRYDRLK